MLQGHTKQNQDSSRTILVTTQLGCTDSLGSRPQYKFIIITSAFSHLGICYNQEVKETDKYLSSKHSFADKLGLIICISHTFRARTVGASLALFSPLQRKLQDAATENVGGFKQSLQCSGSGTTVGGGGGGEQQGFNCSLQDKFILIEHTCSWEVCLYKNHMAVIRINSPEVQLPFQA